MILLDVALPHGHLSVICLSNWQFKATASRLKFKNADEIDCRWLCFAVRIERYKDLGPVCELKRQKPFDRAGTAGPSNP
jgi:hypothetical protein